MKHYGFIISNYAASADKAIKGDPDPENMKKILQDLVDTAALNKLYWKRE